MATLLTQDEIDEFVRDHDNWESDGKSFRKTYEFKDFNQSMGFVTRVGLKAERIFHHPDIDIRWNKVTLSLSTHSEGGLTSMDIELAEFSDSC